VPIFVIAIVLDCTLTLLVILLPGHAKLQRSGTYCIPDSRSDIYKGYVAVCMMLISMLVGIYIRIYIFYRKINSDRSSEEEKGMQKRRRKLMQRFGLISISTLIGTVPSSTIVFIQMGSQKYPPVIVDGLVMLFISLTCITNPIVYFWTNESARNALLLNLGLKAFVSST